MVSYSKSGSHIYAFFSGLHAHTTVFMAITEINDSVMILPEKAGGHMATKAILERLGLNVYELEINYETKHIDIAKSEQLMKKYTESNIC